MTPKGAADIAQIPLNIGMDFQIVIGPRLANCPKHSSNKKIGTPTNISINT